MELSTSNKLGTNKCSPVLHAIWDTDDEWLHQELHSQMETQKRNMVDEKSMYQIW